jgi:hypothetical protein
MDAPLVEFFKHPEWSPLPLERAVGVAGPTDAVVACLEGHGFTTVGDVSAPLAAGERTFWPAGVFHRLWTEARR